MISKRIINLNQNKTMSALYDLLPVPFAGDAENAPKLYPKMVAYQTVTFDQLVEKIASHSGLTRGNILAVMEEIEYWTAQLLSAYSGGYPFSISGDIRSLPS